MPPRKKRAARMQAHRSRSPPPPLSPPALDLPVARQTSQTAKSKATGKRKRSPAGKKINPWRKLVKGGDRGEYFISKITGESLEPGRPLKEIATVPFMPEYFMVQQLWDRIFLFIDVVTASVFSITWKYGLFLLEDEGKRREYLAWYPEASFLVRPDYRCPSKDGSSIWLRGLIEEWMGPKYQYDAYIKRYRKLKDAKKANEEYAQESEDHINEVFQEIKQEEEDWQDGLRAKVCNLSLCSPFLTLILSSREPVQFLTLLPAPESSRKIYADLLQWDELVEGITDRNEKREEARKWAREGLRQLAEDGEQYESDEDVSVVSSDEELPDYDDFVEDPDEYMVNQRFTSR